MATYRRISAGSFFEVWHQEERPNVNPIGIWRHTASGGWMCQDAYGHTWHISAKEHDEAVVEGFEFPQQSLAQAR